MAAPAEAVGGTELHQVAAQAPEHLAWIGRQLLWTVCRPVLWSGLQGCAELCSHAEVGELPERSATLTVTPVSVGCQAKITGYSVRQQRGNLRVNLVEDGVELRRVLRAALGHLGTPAAGRPWQRLHDLARRQASGEVARHRDDQRRLAVLQPAQSDHARALPCA